MEVILFNATLNFVDRAGLAQTEAVLALEAFIFAFVQSRWTCSLPVLVTEGLTSELIIAAFTGSTEQNEVVSAIEELICRTCLATRVTVVTCNAGMLSCVEVGRLLACEQLVVVAGPTVGKLTIARDALVVSLEAIDFVFAVEQSEVQHLFLSDSNERLHSNAR